MPARILLSLVVSVLAGCLGGPGRPPSMADMDIIAQDERFALVRLKYGQDLRYVATAFYRNPHEAWQLREVNANTTGRAGQVLAVPLSPVNPSSVYPDGFRTLPILCYHQFTHKASAAHGLELTAEVFEQQIRYLIANNYQILSMADVATIMRAGRPIPEKAVVITIDDGYRSVYEVAWPLLQKYQVRATLFVYTDFVGATRALSWAQMEEMAASGLIEIQSHARSHTNLSRQPSDENTASYSARVKQEIISSDAAFKRHLGAKPSYLSYPYGNSSDTAAHILEQQGYLLAATVTRGDNTVFTDRFLLHRTMIYADHDLDEFARMVRTYRGTPLQ